MEQAISDLGYTPNFGARALASNRTGTIGVIIPTMDNAIFAHGIQAMEEALSEHDITLLLATSRYSAEREFQKIRALVSRGVDSLALIGFARPEKVYDFLSSRSVPFVVLWDYLESSAYPCIGFNNHKSAAMMARRVIDLGHRRIAMIAGRREGNDRASQRIEGVEQELADHGLTLMGNHPIEAYYSLNDGESACLRLLSGHERPTAIICGNDVIAAGAIRAVRQMGLKVPEDISIVGFDDIELASALDPPLTTVRTPHRRMGRAAAEMLMALPTLDDAGSRLCFETRIVNRGSLIPVNSATAME